MAAEVISLGCRLNLAESEEMRAMLAQAENLVVINSCAVTAEAVRQTRQAIRRARKDRPDARLLVTGCAAEIEREALGAMPEVDGLIANAAKLDARVWNVPPAQISTQANHTRAFVAVQNGCDHACTFCVIPQGRGGSRSLTVATVLRRVALHLDQGAAEVVLTGVDLTSWGHDLCDQPRLGHLAAAVLAAFPDMARLRLSSLDGVEIDDQLFDLITTDPRIMPHVHLSLQHGNDLILKRMKRRHSRQHAVDLVRTMKTIRPDIAIGADLIAGFPTEDDEAHRDNRSLIADLNIVHGHIFPYSPRPGTPAARMPQVAPAVAKARAMQLRTDVAEQRARWLAAQIGQTQVVLAERDGTGHAENFARVQLAPGTKPGTVVKINPTRIIEGLLA